MKMPEKIDVFGPNVIKPEKCYGNKRRRKNE
jgi:hypothetical protein